MAKIKSLSGAPEDFHIPITVRELDGTESEIIFTFKGRTLREWHPMAVKRMTEDANAMIDAAEEREKLEGKAADTPDDAEEKPKRKTKAKRLEYKEDEMAAAVQKGLARAADILNSIAVGWDLEDEFNAENLQLLCSRYPGVHQSAWEKYDARIRGNRLGN